MNEQTHKISAYKIVKILMVNFAYYKDFVKKTDCFTIFLEENESIKEHVAKSVKESNIALFPDTKIYVIESEIDAYEIYKLGSEAKIEITFKQGKPLSLTGLNVNF